MSIFHQFIKSIYSPQHIATFRSQGIGKTILYIFFLMLLTFAVGAYQLGSIISTNIHQFQKTLETEIPDIQLKDGILYSELNEPLVIHDNNSTFVIDATGSTSISDLEYQNGLALLKNEFVFISQGIPQSFRYREFGNITLSKEQLEELTTTIVDLLPLIITVIVTFLYLLLTLLKFIGVFSLSLIGLILRKNSKATLPYKKVWILSAYAVTLPTLFFAITDALYIYIPFSFTLYWVVAIIMLHLTYREIPREINEE